MDFRKKLVLSTFFLCFFFITTAQKDDNLEVFGTTRHNGKNLSGVIVSIIKDGEKTDDFISRRNGSFNALLKFQEVYTIEFSKENYVTQKIVIDTKIPNSILKSNDADLLFWEMETELTEMLEGLDIALFQEPIARYSFDKETWRFEKDENLATKISLEMETVHQEIVKIKKELYKKRIDEADKYFANDDYENALFLYQQAADLQEEEKYPKDKVKSLRKTIKKEMSVKDEYNKLVTKADGLLSENKLDEASDYYKKAGLYDSKAQYVQDKLYEIDSIKSYSFFNQKSIYAQAIKQADSCFLISDYNNAKGFYQQASQVLPGEMYPVNRLNEIESKLMDEGNSVVPPEDHESLLTEKTTTKPLAEEEVKNEVEEPVQTIKTKPAQIENKKLPKKEVIKKEPEKPVSKIKQEIQPEKKVEPPPVVAKEIVEKEDVNKEKPQVVNDKNKKLTLTEKSEIETDDNIEISEVAVNDSLVSNKGKIRVLLEKLEKKGSTDIEEAAIINRELANLYHDDFKLDKAIAFYEKSIELKKQSGDMGGVTELLGDVATAYYDSGSYKQSLDYYKESLELAEKSNDKKKSAEILTDVAIVYETTFKYDEAIEYYTKSLDIAQAMNDEENTKDIHKNIGNVYLEKNDYEKSIEHFEKTLEIDEKSKDKEDMGSTMNNLGIAYYNLGKYDKAVEFYEKSLKLTIDQKNEREAAISLNNLGNVNFDWSKYEVAIDYYEKSLDLKRKLEFKEGMAVSLYNLGNAYAKTQNYTKALEYFKSSIKLAEELNFKEVVYRNYEAFSNVYSKIGDYKNAYSYHVKYTDSKYKIIDEKSQISEMREQYESTKKVVRKMKRELQKQKILAEYEALKNKRELQIRDLEIENKEQLVTKQRIIILSFFIGIILVLGFSYGIFRQFKLKNKAFEIVASQKKQMTDSIVYASRIQNAVLPPEKYVIDILPEYFLLNRPRDIVGGDFFWVTKRDNLTIVAVADCTGHGVPGGFMSMLGVAFLNEIISTVTNLEPEVMLEMLRSRLIEALHQNLEKFEAKDGMDISLSIFDFEKRTMLFSGAYNPVYLVRNKELETIKADKIPIGIHLFEKPFTSKSISLEKGDMVYFTSDGYSDQLGEKTFKRFLIKPFKELLASISDKSMDKQLEILKTTIDDWRGNLEQTDDILILGIRV